MPEHVPPAPDGSDESGQNKRLGESKRRPRGDGGLRWSESRQRWIAELTIGYTPAGKRIVRTASDKSKTKALKKLQAKLRDREDGLPSEDTRYTVAQAVENWLQYGLSGRAANTVNTKRILARKHVIPELGARKLRELSADDVDQWLAREAERVSTRTLQELRSILKRSVARAQARDKVKRNVVMLCELPQGRTGRPSKSLTMAQAEAVLEAAESAKPWLRAYVVLSLLTGARTEELRGLTWSHVVAYEAEREQWRPVTEAGWEHDEFALYVWRSVRATGDTKTPKSRRTLKLPRLCALVLAALWDDLSARGLTPGEGEHLVFGTRHGTKKSAGNVRREFRRVIKRAGLDEAEWTPREMRHSFVSVLSANGMAVEHISRLVGHNGTAVTEKVYRLQIQPVMEEGATAMDRIFPGADDEA
ncbi:site-specific integrase [Actinomadura roseirufa]|uniref:site-specific integrase n=1 Tax=Actinomadura roseirufa TaxID=2094049 RepID=UPI001040EEF6|nr:site-specific integrase [Actinomadura roseirufa]